MSEATEPAAEPLWTQLLRQVRPLVVAVVSLTILTGLLFPTLLGLIARPLFPHQADGSLLQNNGEFVGSELIAQNFAGPRYFHPRPSAAGDEGYDALSSGGSNLSPSNPKQRSDVDKLATQFRRDNELSEDAVIPIDAVTRSGSGLDPHISPENAALQRARVAHYRGLDDSQVQKLIDQCTRGRQFGILGETTVNVLELNIALDRLNQHPSKER
jgi:K+-transporting ATPase ATPase C chain